MRTKLHSGLIPALSLAAFVLNGCQQVEDVVASVAPTKQASYASDEIPSCDAAFSLAGWFDNRQDVKIEKPAKFPAAGELRRVAVVPPIGEGSDLFISEFERILTSIKVGGQPYFQVISRSEIDRVMKEQGFGRSSAVQQGSAAKLGRILGVDGIYVPQIKAYKVSDEPYQAAGQGGGTCTRRTATFKSIPKLIDVNTGQVVYAEEVGGSRDERYCPGGGGGIDGKLSLIKGAIGGGGLTDGSAMMDSVIDEALSDFATSVAPSACNKKMNIMEAKDGFSDDLTVDQFDGAVAFMKTGRYDRACPSWKKLEAQGEQTIALYNNLAICAELDGQLVKARQYCGKADKMLSRPDPDINLCLENINKRLTESAALRAAGCGSPLGRRDVREAQQLLIDQGYLRGAADGLIGPGTISAAIDFQTANDLPIEGKVDACLLDDLRVM